MDEARCAEILALVDRELLAGIYSAVAAGDRAAAIASLSRLIEGGADPRHVLKEFVAFLRGLLLCAAGAPGGFAEAERERLTALSRAMPYENLLRSVSLALEAGDVTRRVDDPALVIQMLVLKLAELPRLRDIEGALAGRPRPKPAPVSAAPRLRGEGRRAADRLAGAGRARARRALRSGSRRPAATRSSASTRSSTRAGA